MQAHGRSPTCAEVCVAHALAPTVARSRTGGHALACTRARAMSSGGPCDVRVPHSTRSEVPGFGVSRPCPSTCCARALALILEPK
eukprot:15434239-Alexandrium_andersonii.AAC.1